MSALDTAAAGRAKVKNFEILVNGTEFEVENDDVSYEQVTALAYPAGGDYDYSVAYRNARGGRGGSGQLVPGTSVKVKKEGTTFRVTATTRS